MTDERPRIFHDDTGEVDRFDDPAADAEQEAARSRRDRRFLRRLVLAIVVVVAGLYLAGWAFANDRLPRGTTVGGVEVGGMRADEARRELRNALRPLLDDPVPVSVDDRQVTLDPVEAGLDVNVPASIAQVPYGRSWNPADMWESLVGGDDYGVVVVTVDDLLAEELTRLSADLGEAPVQGGIRLTADGPVATFPEPGTGIDVPAAVRAVTAAFPTGLDDPVELPVRTLEPDVTAEAVTTAMDGLANPATSGPVRFTWRDERAVLQPGAMPRVLSFEAVDGALVPVVDRAALRRLVERQLPRLGQGPVDATVAIVEGRPRVVPGRAGVAVDARALAAALPDLLTARGADRQAPLPTRRTAPERTAADVRALGVREQVSEFTTSYPHADYRNVNIGRAASLVDGTLLEPGDTFSLNGIVGERTVANGFTTGFVISDGVFREDLGGGVSQIATTLFNAAFFAGLEDVEHKPHSVYIDRYPEGREATVAWPVLDLKFRNETDHGVLVQAVHQPSAPGGTGSITVRMWSTKTWDITSESSGRYNITSPGTRVFTDDPECVPNTGYGGFDIDITRVFRRAGEDEVVRREVMSTTYIPSDTVICR